MIDRKIDRMKENKKRTKEKSGFSSSTIININTDICVNVDSSILSGM